MVRVYILFHIGYPAENGGRIRGTNGNNPHGDFGSLQRELIRRNTRDSGC